MTPSTTVPSFRRHLISLTALTPISHFDVQTSNKSAVKPFMRAGNRVNGYPERTPTISENSIRTALFRYPLHDHLVQVLDITKGELPMGVMNLLFSGGNRDRPAPADEIELGHQVRRLYPSLDLLGGAVDVLILPRSRLRLAAWIVCEEYAALLDHVSAEHAERARAAGSVMDMLFEETRPRGSVRDADGNQKIEVQKKGVDDADDEQNSADARKLYTYETMNAGVEILVELTLDAHTPEATEAALSVALQAWPGYLGGQGRQGRGRMAVRHDLPSGAAYLAHLDQHRTEMRDGLTSGMLGTKKVLCRL